MASKILIFELSPCFPSTVSRLASLRRFIRPVVYYCGCGDFLRPTLNIRPSTLGRSFSTRSTTSSLNDPSPNWSNRPPKETILLDGCDFEHWLCVMEPPDANWTRDQIIDHYIKTLAQVVGSEHEARMKIYSVSTKHYFAFGANVSEEVSYKLKELPGMRWVLPDSYMDVKNKEYGGEPFINGEAVPYDPKYHEEWVRNNARANERSRRNDRPRNFDRSRNFDRRRDSVQTQGPPPTSPMNQGYQAKPNPTNMPPPQNASQSPPPLTQGGNPSYQQGGAPAYQNVGNTYQTNVGGYQNYQGNPNPNPNPTNYQSNGGFQ